MEVVKASVFCLSMSSSPPPTARARPSPSSPRGKGRTRVSPPSPGARARPRARARGSKSIRSIVSCGLEQGSTGNEKAGKKSGYGAVLLAGLLLLQPCFAAGHVNQALALGWFGLGAPAIENDPVEPFTIYGSVFKKYLIEKLVDGKVVARKKGFTATACVNTLDASKETPELQGVPAGLKVNIIGDPLCARAEGQSKEESCMPSCKRSCIAAIDRHLDEIKEETGYILDSKDRRKVTESCASQCFNECLKPGKSISFVYPFRPSK